MAYSPLTSRNATETTAVAAAAAVAAIGVQTRIRMQSPSASATAFALNARHRQRTRAVRRRYRCLRFGVCGDCGLRVNARAHLNGSSRRSKNRLTATSRAIFGSRVGNV